MTPRADVPALDHRDSFLGSKELCQQLHAPQRLSTVQQRPRTQAGNDAHRVTDLHQQA